MLEESGLTGIIFVSLQIAQLNAYKRLLTKSLLQYRVSEKMGTRNFNFPIVNMTNSERNSRTNWVLYK